MESILYEQMWWKVLAHEVIPDADFDRKSRFCINWIEYVLKKAIFICSFHFFCIIIVRIKGGVEYEAKLYDKYNTKRNLSFSACTTDPWNFN